MKKYKLKNGLTLVYEYRSGGVTSFSVGFSGGSLEEGNFPAGTAHALEHMLYKGTRNRTEEEINMECDKLFGFNNAMTNYPYVIYYGTLMSEEFENGMDLITDIIQNPSFNGNGFKEEMNVIMEELKEWKDDPYQFCEDELFFNSFKERRIKYPIIGTAESIQRITTEDLERFYSLYYTPSNCVISVVSSLEFNAVESIIRRYYETWNTGTTILKEALYEDNKEGLFIKPRDISGAKIYYCFPLHKTNEQDMTHIMILNNILGSGTSSILYDAVRTKNGLAYDVSSFIKNERGLKILEISLGTSYDNAPKAIEIINRCIDHIGEEERFSREDCIENAVKSIKLRKMVSFERSVELAKALTTYELMYGASQRLYDEMNLSKYPDRDDIIRTARKFLNKPSIQIIGQ